LNTSLIKGIKTSLNLFIPALVKSKVGSSNGTTGIEARIMFCFFRRNQKTIFLSLDRSFLPLIIN
jgi:hypothetical protein